jgi:hypothetical protein
VRFEKIHKLKIEARKKYALILGITLRYGILVQGQVLGLCSFIGFWKIRIFYKKQDLTKDLKTTGIAKTV